MFDYLRRSMLVLVAALALGLGVVACDDNGSSDSGSTDTTTTDDSGSTDSSDSSSDSGG